MSQQSTTPFNWDNVKDDYEGKAGLIAKKTIKPSNNLVKIHDNTVVTTSQQIAETFEKSHNHVLRDIRNVLEQIEEIDDVVTLPKFGQCQRINELANGKPEPYYELDKNAFILLVMGYQGEKAMRFKLGYMAQFDAMETYLRDLLGGTAQKPLPTAGKTAQDYFLKNYKVGEKLFSLHCDRVHYANAQTLQQTGVDILADAGIKPPAHHPNVIQFWDNYDTLRKSGILLNHTDAHLKIAVNINYAHAAMCKAGLPVADKTELKRVLRQSAVIGFNAVRHTLIPKFCKANHSVRSLILGGKPMKCWIFEV